MMRTRQALPFVGACIAVAAVTSSIPAAAAPARSIALHRMAGRPVILSYDADTYASSAMQEARGALTVERGCVVLRERDGARLLIWRRPVRVIGSQGKYAIRQMGRSAAIGAKLVLTGTSGGPVSAAFARRNAVPSACRAIATFAVNGILSEYRE